MLYLVDGYNMIGAWPEFRGLTDISQSRELLISLPWRTSFLSLSAY